MDTLPPRRRRSPLPAIVALVVVLAIAGTAVWWWTQYTRSPQYSVGKLATAVSEKDWAGFQRYVDVDAVVTSAVDEGIAATVPQGGGALGGIAERLARAARPGLIQQGKDRLRLAVEQGTVRIDAAEAFFAPSQVQQVDHVGPNDAVVTVRLSRPGDPPRDARLRMRRSGARWKVVAVEDSLEILRSYGVVK